jgi:hypothetical protein
MPRMNKLAGAGKGVRPWAGSDTYRSNYDRIFSKCPYEAYNWEHPHGCAEVCKEDPTQCWELYRDYELSQLDDNMEQGDLF